MTERKDPVSEHYELEAPEGAVLVSEKKRKPGGAAVDPAGKSVKSAEKTRKSAPKKRREPEPPEEPEYEEPEYQSIKTPSVMNLMKEVSAADNQVIAAGKSRMPKQLRRIEPLTRIIRRQAEEMSREENVRSSPRVSRDLTQMIAENTALEILRRFNACQCPRCCGELARLAEAEIPARYIDIPELAGLDYEGFTEDERQLVRSIKKTVVSVMMKLVIGNKKRNFHE